ncbi:MAG: hypothetical protein LBJ59_03830 [Zoogloeaceae bacterium]|nr:hypothetical protein [Zoogloeaceae bacterium]
MKKILALLVLCASVSFARGNDVAVRDLGDFIVKSFHDKTDNRWKLFVYKKGSDKVYQELMNSPGFECEVNQFLGAYTNRRGERYDFMHVCGLGYAPEVFEYFPESKQFYSDEFSFGNNLDALEESKDLYVGATYACYDEDEKKQHDLVLYIFQKPSGDLVQRMDIPGEENNYSGECEASYIKIADYNFDGIDDFSLWIDTDRMARYYLYDPEKKEFFLSNITGVGLEFDHENKTITEVNSCCAGTRGARITYRLERNEMKQIKASCYLRDGEWGGEQGDEDWRYIEFEYDCKDGDEYGAFSTLRSVGLKNRFFLKITLNEKRTAGALIYKGQKEFMRLVLKQKTGNGQMIFDERYKGETTGQYTLFFYRDGSIAGASYMREDGEKFELEEDIPG